MWTYKNNTFRSEDILDYYGFVYIITNKQTHKQYIGRKYFYKIRNDIISESDWVSYTGSSVDLNTDINILGTGQFEFCILELYRDKKDIVNREVELQLENDVLHALDDYGDKVYYNKAIGNKYFELDDDAKRRISVALKGVPKTDECKRKISQTLQGNTNATDSIRTDEYKQKMSKIMKTNSNFVTNNPNKKWGAKLNVGGDITTVIDIAKYCSENNIKYNALRVWSKKNIALNVLHPKYNMKILELFRINP